MVRLLSRGEGNSADGEYRIESRPAGSATFLTFRMLGCSNLNTGDRSMLRLVDRSKTLTDDVNPFEPRTKRCVSIKISEATDK